MGVSMVPVEHVLVLAGLLFVRRRRVGGPALETGF